jgi:hypothetical protein
MTDNNETPITPRAADAVPSDPATLIAQVRAMWELIPDFTHLPVPERKSLAVVAGTDPEFVRASINSASDSPIVEQAIGLTPEALQQETVSAQAWTSLEDEVRGLLAGLVSGNLIRRNRIGELALTAYAVARRLVRRKEHVNLVPHVETMRRLNRFGVGKKAKPAEETPAPAPAPAPATLQS